LDTSHMEPLLLRTDASPEAITAYWEAVEYTIKTLEGIGAFDNLEKDYKELGGLDPSPDSIRRIKTLRAELFMFKTLAYKGDLEMILRPPVNLNKQKPV
jgi:hypothetical protein